MPDIEAEAGDVRFGGRNRTSRARALSDNEREDAYDSHTDKVMPLAMEEGWTVIDMKNDWKEGHCQTNLTEPA